MEDRVTQRRGTLDGAAAYAHSWEYLWDELRCLDLLIHLRVLQQRNNQPSTPLEPFKGLVLSEEEIAALLSGAANSPMDEAAAHPNGAESQTLVEDFRRLSAHVGQRRDASLREGVYLSLPHLAQIFHLTPFEEQCVLICLAPELDRKYEKLFAYLQDDVTRKKPSVDLALNLLCSTTAEKLTARLAFDPQSPLLKYRLLHVTDGSPDGPSPLLSRFLKLDDRIVNFLLGFEQMDARLEPVARLVAPQAALDGVVVAEEVQNRMRRFVRAQFGGAERQNVVFYFYGPYGSGKQSLAEVVCRDIGLPLVVADVSKMLDGSLPFEETAWLLGREAVLQPAALCLENVDGLLTDEKHQAQLKLLLEVARTFARLTFLLGSRLWKPQGLLNEDVFIDLAFPVPDDRTRKRLWESRLNGRHPFASDVDAGMLASKFRFTPGQIQDAIVAAQNLSRWRSANEQFGGSLTLPTAEDAPITMDDLYAACRAQSNQKLSALALKVQPKYAWGDIVLPNEQKGHLREMVNHVKYRHLVYGEWGFERKLSSGKGLNVLFAGPSGTGKTMAAEVIATELSLDLYKIDLSQVVSKYIGETEKNLDRVFREAQTSNAILFFDEADALFGKRSEVKDAHDRYANIEVGYLLQKMEEYEGVAILATNLRTNLDEAFARRMHFTVEFPFPDEEYRARIWGGIFPSEAPLAADVDFATLARSFKLSGGNIKNIALAAAFLAADEEQPIGMKHLMQAAKREFQKVGRTMNGE
jgi:SpoVK/Ycf46/Vps4 family AAA+-type ATPase